MKKLISLALCAMLLVCLLAPTAFAAAEVRYTVDGVTKEGTLNQAVAEVSPRGGEIVLLQDIHVPRSTREYAIESQSSVTLDLNGHILSGYRPIRFAGKGILSTSLVTDTKGTGAIVGEHISVSVTEGGLHLKGVRIWSKTAQAISYDDFSGDYNSGNLIEDSIVVSGTWGAISFNHTARSQEKTYFTIRNSVLANVNGGNTIVHQRAAVGGHLELLENVQFLSYVTTDSPVQAGFTLHGETLTKTDTLASVEVAGNYFEGLGCWKTPATATVSPIQHPPMPKTYSAWITTEVLPASAPAEPAKPAEPATPAQPSVPAETPTQTPAEVPNQPAAPAQTAQQIDHTVVIAVVAAAIVVAVCAVSVAVVIALKYTKKMKDE